MRRHIVGSELLDRPFNARGGIGMQRHKQWYVPRSKQCFDTQLDSESGEVRLYECMRWFHCGEGEKGDGTAYCVESSKWINQREGRRCLLSMPLIIDEC